MNNRATRNILMTLSLVTLFGVAGTAGAAPHAGDNSAAMPMNMGNNMTPEQQEAARKIYNEQYAVTEGLQRQIMSKRAEIEAQIYAAKPDTAKVEALSREIGELHGKLLTERMKLRDKLSAQGLPTAGCMDGMGMGGMGMGGYHGGGKGGHGGGMGGRGGEMGGGMGGMGGCMGGGSR